MHLLPLTLEVNIEGSLLFESRKADAAFLRIQKKIWQRDDYVCKFCGFKAEEHQEVVNIDGDYRNDNPANLATACVFCTHTQLVGLKNNSKIIYLPDISQVDLNQLMRILFCSSYYGEQQAETAKTLIQALKQRNYAIENIFGKDSSDSVLFAQTYIDAVNPQQSSKQAADIFAQLRWLPSRTDYEDIIHYWAEHVLTRDIIEQRIVAYGTT